MPKKPGSAFKLNLFIHSIWSAFLACAGALVLASACNQPDPMMNDDDDDDTVSETMDMEESSETSMDTGTDGGDYDELSSYYPMVDGAKWVYATKNAQSQQGASEEVTIVAEIDPETNESVYRLTDNEDPDGELTSSVLIRKGTASMRVHKNVIAGGASILMVEYDPGFMRFDDSWANEAEGYSISYDYMRTASDTPQPEIRRHTYEIFALHEDVTVPAGTYTDCIKIQRTRDTGSSAGERVQSWYAKGVGKVKEHRIDDGKFELLESVSIPGSKFE